MTDVSLHVLHSQLQWGKYKVWEDDRMRMFYPSIEDHCLYVDRDTTIKTIYEHLHCKDIDKIIVQDKDGKDIGYVPLCHLLRLLTRDIKFCDHLIEQFEWKEIQKAMQGEVVASPLHVSLIKHFICLPDKQAFDFHHALVIIESNKDRLSSILESEASCIVVAHCEFVSQSLINKAKEEKILLLKTPLSAITAANALWMQMPVGKMMERFHLHG